MKSKIFRWYQRHENAVNTLLEIACDTIPGGAIIKGVFNLAHSIDQDNEEVEDDQRIEELEKMLVTMKPQMSDLVEEIEELKGFKEAKTLEETRKMIYENQHIVEELNELLPVMSTSITSSVNKLNSLEQSCVGEFTTILGGKYTLERCLATGGQGAVYYGRNTVADREVAIKLLPKEFTSNTHGIAMLKQEYKRLVNKLSHSNIVQYRDLDFSQEKQQWFITMDYIDGDTLRKSIFKQQRKPFSPEEVHTYLMPVAQALEYAHNNDIVHCDLKPENIMIAQDGNILLTDFGLSQEIQQSVIFYETKHMQKIVGTLPYMAPEQYKGWGVSKHTDVWALGVIMYEMLAGRHPFQGNTYEHYKDIICNEHPRPLDDQRIWQLIQQALDKNDRERITSPIILVKQLLQTDSVIHQPIITAQEGKFQKKLYKKNEINERSSELDTNTNIMSTDDLYFMGSCYFLGINNTIKDPQKARDYFEQAAKKGSNLAMCNLGKMYYLGNGVQENYTEALKWFRKSAELRNSKGMYYLGMMYEKGRGVEQDDGEAVKWYTKSAELGDKHAMWDLACIYKVGSMVKQDYEQTVKWYKKLAEQGHGPGTVNLGEMYVYGYGVEKDTDKAIEWFKKAMKLNENLIKGVRGSEFYRFGRQYEYGGGGVKQDYAEAIKWYQAGAEIGCKNAMVCLGWMYHWGRGVEQNYDEAVKWYTKSAELGNSSAANTLGYMYQRGYGIEENSGEAFRWYRKSAELGDREGMFHIAKRYLHGEGVEKNYPEAIKWYRKSAELNYGDAMNSLGDIYSSKLFQHENYEEAVKWLKKSAKLNTIDKNGMFNLGLMYENGKGIKKDYDEAVKWYEKAAELEDAIALKKLVDIYSLGLGPIKPNLAKAKKYGQLLAKNNMYKYQNF